MKLVLTALNAKYIHTSLSVRCLYASLRDICDCVIKEYTINDSLDGIASDIYAQSPDAVAFSCYIWNIGMVLKIASVLKKAKPDIKVILGGYEVEFDSESILKVNPQIDAVVRGEGEITLRNYVYHLQNPADSASLCSVTYRSNGEIIHTPDCTECADMDELPFVYDDTIDQIKNRIIYYESSRGCPYRCTYCISGETSRVRFRSVDRVIKELAFFMEHKVPLVKFVDRTFNANPKRAKEIFKFVADHPSDTCFHMELAGDIIDDETIDILSKVKKGTLQFEIGVQTTNADTMNAIERNISFQKLSAAVKRLMEAGNIHIHLDLIAGLPHEDLTSFKRSFNEVMALKPHVLQLGFLKLLKGSKIRSQEKEYGYVYREWAPYEVISNDFISYDDILELKLVEEALERYYNSPGFANALAVLFGSFNTPYDVFLTVGKYFRRNYASNYAFSKQTLYDILHNCFEHLGTEFTEALKKDYLISFRPGKRPKWFGAPDQSLTARTYELFKDEEYKKEYFPKYYDVPAKEILKHIHSERFSYGVLVFDYSDGTVHDVSQDI